MATLQEQTERVNALTTKLNAVSDAINKIGSETSKLVTTADEMKKTVADLKDQITALNNAPQDLIDAVNAADAKADALISQAKTVDDLVPDAPTP